MQRSPVLLPIEQAPSIGPENHESAFCITLYNEPWTRLSATIRSIVVSSERARTWHSHHYLICIVADGRERIAECTRRGLKHSGLIVPAPMKVSGVEIHVTRHEASRLIGKCQLRGHPLPVEGHVHVALCIKDTNRGKLDSHRVFFDILCRWLSPKFCYQVDAGSTISVDAISQCIRRFIEDPAVAALGPCVTPEIPPHDAGLLHLWQYHDFAMRQAMLFPLESSLDFLSVLPGQASVIRWSALQPDHPGAPHSVNDPIRAYLYGIANGSSLRRLMYLSEDRVIGAAIVLDRAGSWRLNYLPEAQVVTDACESLDELLRQRRRWMNSAMICRIWLLLQCARLLAFRHRAFGLKARQLSSIFLQALVGLREFTAPAQLVAMILLLAGTMRTAPTPATVLLALFGMTVSAELMLIALEARTIDPVRKLQLRRLGSALALISLGMLIAGLVIAVSPVALAVALAPAMLGIVCMWLVLPARSIPVLAKMHFSPVQQSVIFNLFLGYALWNLNDASWGTKGLTRTPGDASMTTSLLSIRRMTLVTWVAVNSLLIGVATVVDGRISGLNPVVEGMWLADAALVVYSLAWFIVRRAKRRDSTSAFAAR